MPCARAVAAVVLVSCIVSTAGAQVINPTKKAPVGSATVEGADLVVTDLYFPRSNMLRATSGRQGLETPWLEVRAEVTNRGNQRWASRGTVTFAITPGNVDLPPSSARPRRGTRSSGGVSVIPEASGKAKVLVRVPPTSLEIRPAPIRGSLGPGDSVVAQMQVRRRLAPAGRDTVSLELGKYYTFTAEIKAADEANPDNNVATRVGRLERGPEGYEMVWEPIRTKKTGATVTVNAPE